jgi:6-phosphogluconolactonase
METSVNDKPEQTETGAPEEQQQVTPGAATTETRPAPAEERPWLPSPPQLFRYQTPEALAKAAAKRVLDSAQRAVDKFDHFVMVLAGGSTPRLLYSLLTEPPYRDGVPWDRTFFVFGDERCVPPDDEASNYRMARETLFEPLEIPELRVLRMKGEQVPKEAAGRYLQRLDDLFLLRKSRRFDLVLLGIGADGHTASLYPGTEALEEQEKWVVANQVPRLDAWRLTLTFPALNAAQRVIFMASGEEKAQVIAEAFGGVEHPQPHPCERVAPLHARREVLVDHAAASKMPQEEQAAGEESSAAAEDESPAS